MNEPFAIQVVVDCSSPHALADWWAETLGWQVEPQDETFIRSMIEQGFAEESDTVTHKGSLVWATGTAITAGEAASGGQPRILFQQVPEAKTVKNRLHFDIRAVDRDSLGDMHEQLVARGAIKVGGGQQGPHLWVTYTDPEGNEFCIDA